MTSYDDNQMFMHAYGACSVDTKEGWIATIERDEIPCIEEEEESYGLTAEELFKRYIEDVTLAPVKNTGLTEDASCRFISWYFKVVDPKMLSVRQIQLADLLYEVEELTRESYIFELPNYMTRSGNPETFQFYDSDIDWEPDYND